MAVACLTLVCMAGMEEVYAVTVSGEQLSERQMGYSERGGKPLRSQEALGRRRLFSQL